MATGESLICPLTKEPCPCAGYCVLAADGVSLPLDHVQQMESIYSQPGIDPRLGDATEKSCVEETLGIINAIGDLAQSNAATKTAAVALRVLILTERDKQSLERQLFRQS